MKNIALIGCGRIVKRHLQAIEIHPELQVTVACDLLESRANIVAEQTGARVVSNMLDIGDVDIAVILTPSGMHPRHTMDIVGNTHVPIIVTEKPIALTVREALELYECVSKNGKRFLPVYQNRYNPLIAHIRDLLVSGKLGHVYQFICNVLWNRNDAYFADDWHGSKTLDGGVLYTQASHYIDMLHFFFGELENYNGIGSNKRQLECYDSMAVTMQFKNGTIGSLNASVNAYEKNYATELTLVAQKGIIHLSGTNLNEISHWSVEGMEKPNLDFHLNHVYGKGHDTMYRHIVNENWQAFPTQQEILSGIALMEHLSY